jgi:hypothetical protein
VSSQTLILIGFAYIGIMLLVFCLLFMAKRGDEDQVAWDAEHRGDDKPGRRDAA